MSWSLLKLMSIGSAINIWLSLLQHIAEYILLFEAFQSKFPTSVPSPKLCTPLNQKSWTKKTDAGAEAPVLWPSDVKSWLIGKDPDSGRDWGKEKVTTEDEMLGWHYWLNGHEFEQTPGVADGQGGLVCYSPWGHKESDRAEQLNWIRNLALQFYQHKARGIFSFLARGGA